MPMMLWQLQSPTPERILDVTREILNRSEFGAASAWQQWLYHLAKQANQKMTDFAPVGTDRDWSDGDAWVFALRGAWRYLHGVLRVRALGDYARECQFG